MKTNSRIRWIREKELKVKCLLTFLLTFYSCTCITFVLPTDGSTTSKPDGDGTDG